MTSTSEAARRVAKSRGASRSAVVVLLAAVAFGLLLGSGPALGHAVGLIVHADVTAPERGKVRAELDVEYHLLVVSAASEGQDNAFSAAGVAASEGTDKALQVEVLRDHADTVLAYIGPRFTIATPPAPCTPSLSDKISLYERNGAPHATLTLDYDCPGSSSSHEITSTLFSDDEAFVHGTQTIVTYDLDLASGSASLDANNPSFSTDRDWHERFWEFFKSGAEHLYGGIDHILFLLALIDGSRRLREVVLAATTFTLAHSVTLILAALGLVNVRPAIIEPIIAGSIASNV
jgi:hypothetical protein